LINEKYAHKILIFFNSSIPLETRPSAWAYSIPIEVSALSLIEAFYNHSLKGF
jgi:hypothetical protein